MARMPGTTWAGEKSPKTPMARYDAVCVHTIVGYAPAHAAHFSVKANGQIIQSRDTRYRSGANLNGNHRIIAIENEDHGPAFGSWNINDGHAVPALTAAQVEANAKILAWAYKTHGIPLQLCPNSKPSSCGLAYHRQGIDGNWSGYDYPGRVSGGEVWTEHFGKVCPGDRRIAQRPAILGRAQQIVNGEDDMPTAAEVAKALLDTRVENRVTGKTIMLRDLLPFMHEDGVQINTTRLPRIETRVVALQALVEQMVERDPSTPLTGAEVKAIVEQAIADNIVKVDVTIAGQEPAEP